MNPNYTPQTESKADEKCDLDLDLAESIIIEAINIYPDCFIKQINEHNAGRVSNDCIGRGISTLIDKGIIRQRECPYEHDWEYLLCKPSNHCLECGDTHTGECDPSSFEYFICKDCGRGQVIPWDAVAMCGLAGTICGCGAKAEDAWQHVSYEQYQAIEYLRQQEQN